MTTTHAQDTQQECLALLQEMQQVLGTALGLTIPHVRDIGGAREDGLISSAEALRQIGVFYREIEAARARLDTARDHLRAVLTAALEDPACDGTVTVAGFGALRIRPGYEVRSFARKEVEKVIAALQAANLTQFAEQLRDCEQVSARSGSLEVRLEKPKGR